MARRYKAPLDEVTANLKYNSETGLFTWLRNKGKTAKMGDVAGAVHKSGYRRIGVCGAIVYAHRLAWLVHYGAEPVGQIDHINGNKDDNRIENLRDVTPEINMQNKPSAQPRSKSGVIGVVGSPEGDSWAAQISFKGRVVRVGGFTDIEDAHGMYLELRRRLHDGYIPRFEESRHPKT